MNPLSNGKGIRISPLHWSQMEADVRSKTAEEACGIVAGEGNQSRLVIPMTNILHSLYSFRMEPKEELDAFLLLEEKGLEVLAIYHSHPHGIDRPSVTDLDELTFPGIVYLIWFEQDTAWRCRAYLMNSGQDPIEVPLIVSD